MMTKRHIDAFFYGLFMDVSVLRDTDVTPTDPRPGYVDGFALRIGQRATLVPAHGARAYGMLVALTHRELDRLYSGPGLEHYLPEAVLAHTLKGDLVAALCYNLREVPSPHEHNPEYASRLRGVLRELGFPREYIESIS
ncbi:MAG TPA: gamma-glutamylcyclotransferase family protein [Thermoanaerobaculia bacterium]|jgi:hypothetical protein